MQRFCLVLFLACRVHAQEGAKLIWGDEFEGPRGARPESTNWNYDLGGGGWGNSELQVYTDSAENAFLNGNDNNSLVFNRAEV